MGRVLRSLAKRRDVLHQAGGQFLALPAERAGSVILALRAGPRPSTALQRRTLFHAYLSGAHTIHEEWGAENNLLDWRSGELSSYGRVTREFLDFLDAVPDVGVPYTPIALLLDTSRPPPVTFERAPFGGRVARWYAPRSLDIAWAHIQIGMYGIGAPTPGRHPAAWLESGHYPPSPYPELFDIVPADAPEAILAGYRRVVAVGDGRFPARAEVVPVADQFRRVAEAVCAVSPFHRTGDLVMQVNVRAADNTWIVGLYNPRGAYRGDVLDTGSILDPDCEAVETLTPKFPFRGARLLHGWPARTALEVGGDRLRVTVGAGGLAPS